MTVTIVIPAYNAEGFLARAVASALAAGPQEVIIVDDASTDATLAAAKALAGADPRVRVLALPVNGGPSTARNAGFAAAGGDWIAVLDADDAITEGRLAHLMAAAEGADIVADNIAIYDAGAAQVTGVGVPNAQPREIDIHSFVGASRGAQGDMDWGLLKPMFRRAFLQQHGLTYPETIRHGEDFVFVFRALLAGAKFSFTPEAGYLHTQRVGALSGAQSGMSRTRIAYDAMARDTLALMEEPAVRADPRLLELLRERHKAIRVLEARHQPARYVGERRFGKLLGLVISNPASIGTLWTLAKRRLRKLAA